VSSALSLSNVSVRAGNRLLLDRVGLEVASGERLALMGPSGAGKSTLLRVIMGLRVPEEGQVTLGGQPVSSAGRILIPPERRGLSVVFQDLALWPHLTVCGNLRFVLRARGTPASEHDQHIRRALDQVRLTGAEKRYPGELSGGERQRVAIARALVAPPLALLLDEPLANLDVMTHRDLVGLLQQLFQAQRTTVIHITHDLSEAAALCTSLAVLEAGHITYRGPFSGLGNGCSPFATALSSSRQDLQRG